MARKDLSYSDFSQFLPLGTLDKVLPWFSKYPIHLLVTRERRSILGNYRSPHAGNPVHRVTVNGNLNPYAFLVTLLHELAHLEAWVQFKNRIQPHGPEWQKIYRQIMLGFLDAGHFPEALEQVLKESVQKAKASTCAEPALTKALMAYDTPVMEGLVLLETLQAGQKFVTKEGRVFELVKKRRTRFLCRHLKSNRDFTISGIAVVKPIE